MLPETPLGEKDEQSKLSDIMTNSPVRVNLCEGKLNIMQNNNNNNNSNNNNDNKYTKLNNHSFHSLR